MTRDYYSYWLTIYSDDPDMLTQVQAWLRERNIVPDYLAHGTPDKGSVSYDVGECGTIEETDEICNALKKLAVEMPSLSIYFDENDEDDHSIHTSHYWHNGKYACDTSDEASPDELCLKAEDPERYEFVRAKRGLGSLMATLGRSPADSATMLSGILCKALTEIDCAQAKVPGGTVDDGPSNKVLSGGFHRVLTRACLSDVEFQTLEGEYPLAELAVSEPYLLDYANGLGYSSLSEFFSGYDTEDTEGMEADAELNHALAFVYVPKSDEPFRFPANAPGKAMLAFADFLSEMLQDAGHGEASKYLDCLLSL